MNQAIAALVRRHDPDRFLTALFAPPQKRDVLTPGGVEQPFAHLALRQS